jgi:alkanesulfonate monooxygenase SsuD/methylene tetrahydromethanopterin reductase-like flavin-dependent oxidoreductase (luciferase family)
LVPDAAAESSRCRPRPGGRDELSVRFGLGLFTAQVPAGSGRTPALEYAEILELVELAEACGFDSAWVSEHHGAADGHLPCCLPLLAACAARTRRILLGTGVLLAPFHEPHQLARDAATLHQLSGGRLLLGIGMGWRDQEFRMFGLERSRRLALTLDALRRIRAIEGAPPVLLGGLVEPAVRRAGRLADGYTRSLVGVGIETGIAAGREALGWFDAAAREAGRDPRSLPVALFQNCYPGPWDEVRAGVLHQLGVYRAWHAGWDVPGRRLEPLPPPEEEARAQTPSGDAAAVAAALAPLVREFGVDRELHLVVRLHYPGMDAGTAARAIEVFATDVMPALA